ncbi:MAG: hypothetical protein JOZ08_26435 [Verrucomicrobia bacterium]|nr:hypothetical protein [Verrucomicrobiota bacterium]MBV8278794.1 hypothetical protein [Verrucomicrobiota bacterium]
MSATIIPFTPAKAVLPVDRRRSSSRNRVETVAKCVRSFERETRLWKVGARQTDRVSATIHLFSFALFFLAGQTAIVTGFTQSSHLLKNDAIGHVAKRALDRDLKEQEQK